MKYLVGITTHDKVGNQIDAWEGYHIEANDAEQAAKEAIEWDIELMTSDGATNIGRLGNQFFCYMMGGEEFYREIHIDVDED